MGGWAVWHHGLAGTASSWAGFIYVGLFSSFLGFFAWYHGLAVGGVARVSQLQLIQPFMTIGFSAALLRERVTLGTVLCAAAVAATIVVGRRTRVHRRA